METKEHIRKAAIKSFREQSAVGKLKGKHNFKEFNDYIAAFERGAEYVLQSQEKSIKEVQNENK